MARQNPRACGPDFEGKWGIAFKVNNNDSEPLFWTGSGFKNLAVVRTAPKEFASREEAEKAIREEILMFIRKWRSDQVDLITGWSD